METGVMHDPSILMKKTRKKSLFSRLQGYWPLYLMLLPGLLYYIVYRYLPMYGLIIAFKEFDFSGGIMGSPWANPWYKYYMQFFSSPYFSQLFVNTFLISFYKIIFGLLPSIVFAVLLNECRSERFKRWIQTLSYMPHFMSWVIIYGICIAFLSQSTGLINRWVVELGGNSLPFLTSTEWFRSLLVGTEVWQNLGWGAIIFLASMISIDPSLYEAARIDGASRLKQIWHITLPGILNVIILMVILKLGHILDAGFEQIYIMYNIRVYAVADIFDTWVFRTGLEQMNFSLAAAVGFFKSVIGFVLVFATNRIAKKWGYGIW